jgi:GTP-binding protein
MKPKSLKLQRLRRAFLLVDALHGLKESDEELIAQLRQHGVSHQIILSKVDRVLMPRPKASLKSQLESSIGNLEKIYQNVRVRIQPGKLDGPEALGEIISCSTEKSLEQGKRPGINQVRWAVLTATGLSLQKKMIASPSSIE